MAEDYNELSEGPISKKRLQHHLKSLANDNEWMTDEVKQYIEQQNQRIKDLETVARNVLNLLNEGYNRVSLDEVVKAGWMSAAVTNSIQDLDCILNGEGSRK
jgi:hypothetical protein